MPRWLPDLLIGVLIVAGIAIIVVGLIRGDGDQGGDGGHEGDAAQQGATQPSVSAEPFADRFRIGVPAGWRRSFAAGTFSFSPSGGGVELRVQLKAGERQLSELASAAARYLAARARRGRVEGPRRTRVGGVPALRLAASYPGGRTLAAVLSSGGYSYLIFATAERSAGPLLRRQLEAALASYRPQPAQP